MKSKSSIQKLTFKIRMDAHPRKVRLPTVRECAEEEKIWKIVSQPACKLLRLLHRTTIWRHISNVCIDRSWKHNCCYKNKMKPRNDNLRCYLNLSKFIYSIPFIGRSYQIKWEAQNLWLRQWKCLLKESYFKRKQLCCNALGRAFSLAKISWTLLNESALNE